VLDALALRPRGKAPRAAVRRLGDIVRSSRLARLESPVGDAKSGAVRYDHVIVGGDSAGCLLAARLSEDPGVRVCTLEAGPANDNFFVRMPFGIVALMRSRRRNWRFRTEPEPNCAGRRMFWPRGRMLGGSSAVNAMCCTRGHRRSTTTGRRWATTAGATPRCCRISSVSSIANAARMRSTARAGRTTSPSCAIPTCSASLSSKPRSKPGFRVTMISTVRTRKAWAVRSDAEGWPALQQRACLPAHAGIRRHGIPQVLELPGVGKNLQDHPDVYTNTPTTMIAEKAADTIRRAH